MLLNGNQLNDRQARRMHLLCEVPVSGETLVLIPELYFMWKSY